MSKKTVTDIDPNGKRVLVRVDFNVPLDDAGRITDDRRIRQTLPTLVDLVSRGAKVVLMSHMGRPDGKVDPKFTLAPAAARLSELLGKPVPQAPDCVGPEVRALVDALAPGDVLLLENLRFHREEEHYSATDAESGKFADALSALGDAYVNDAFGAAHRAHASMVGVPSRIAVGSRALGLLFEKELHFLGQAVGKPSHPYVAVLGGAKVSDKIKVIENLSLNVDVILVGGAMAYTFMAARGDPVGTSRVETAMLDKARELMKLCEDRQCTLLLPVDHRLGDRFAADAEVSTSMGIIPDGRMGLDIGPETEQLYREIILEAKMRVWNGPMGVFEWDRFASGTKAVAEAMAKAAAGGLSIVGGGDTAAAADKFQVAGTVSWVSTGGGATLEFLEGKNFPALEFIDDK